MEGSETGTINGLDERATLHFAPWDGRRVPVTMLGGYLGAGKTTVINELLATTDRPVAVLVNDVGTVNVDAALLARRSPVGGARVVELTDGCVCCSLAGGLAEAFDAIRARPEPPDHLILELSGIADPARVVPWADSDGFRLDGVVVLADAEQFLDQETHPVIGATVQTQLAAADMVIVTKSDLVGPQQAVEVERRLAELVPGAPILRPPTATATASLLGTATRRPGGVASTPQATLFDVHVTTTVSVPTPVTTQQLDAILDELPPDVVRAKGVVRDPSGTALLVQVVGHRRSIEPLPGAEDQPPTDLVVIATR